MPQSAATVDALTALGQAAVLAAELVVEYVSRVDDAIENSNAAALTAARRGLYLANGAAIGTANATRLLNGIT